MALQELPDGPQAILAAGIRLFTKMPPLFQVSLDLLQDGGAGIPAPHDFLPRITEAMAQDMGRRDVLESDLLVAMPVGQPSGGGKIKAFAIELQAHKGRFPGKGSGDAVAVQVLE